MTRGTKRRKAKLSVEGSRRKLTRTSSLKTTKVMLLLYYLVVSKVFRKSY